MKRLRYIGFLIATLLLLSGMVGQAWGKVTYHILTLPFTTKNDDGTTRGTYIVEALRCTSDELTVGLPEFFKSPLVSPTSFRYYAAANVTVNNGTDTRSRIYQYITTTYDTYAIPNVGDSLHFGSSIEDNSVIYVTYSYDNSTSPIKLDGSVAYNIMLGNRFLAFNKGRNNRTAAILASQVTNENLVSEDFTFIEKPGFDSNKNQWFHFLFKYEGNDPYNITIRTAYNGNGTFLETDKALNKTVLKWYKGSSIFSKGESDGHQMLWLASDDDWQYTSSTSVERVSKPGFYRGGEKNQSEMNPIFNSFAILNSTDGTGYIYMGSKINTNGNNWQPNGNGQYFYLVGNGGRDPKYQLKTPANADKSISYPIDTFTYKVTSALGSVVSVEVKMSNYEKTGNILSYIPDGIKRKYVTFNGAYKTSDLDGIADNEITTFSEAIANGKVIWLKYTSSMPFEALSSIDHYDNARWYTIRMNGDQENKNVVFYDTSNGNAMSAGPARGSESDIHTGENSPEAKVAFIGDPFELKIICHKASEDVTDARVPGGDPIAADNRYIGCSTSSSNGNPLTGDKSGTSDISTWEIVYENTQMETMILREMGTVEAPRYIGWDNSAANKPMIYSTSSGSRIKVVALDKKNYVYHIMRADHSIAVKATEAQDVGRRLKYTTIPEIIRSPLIDPSVYTATVTFYFSEADAIAGTNAHNHAPYDPATEGFDIYVRYTTTTTSLTKNYHVRLNGQYLYYNPSDENINSQAEPEASDENFLFVWHLNLDDPYSMTVENMYTAKTQYVKKSGAEWADNQALAWDVNSANASLFIAKSSTATGAYEVMAATGDGIDASTINYNIARSAVNTVKMYANSTYGHGYEQLRFELIPTDATAVDYHLYDKAGNKLLTVRSRSNELYFPADYRSPLVETYHYWTTSERNVTLSALASATDQEGDDAVPDVYVTYTTSSRINLQKGVMYLLKYDAGDSFRQEDGADGLTASAVQAVYPYCNGDCNFFVYGQAEYDLQQQGAASTRTRWAWYLESANNDPYHVKICSRQTETFNNTENRGYFRTYVETFDGDPHVVTNLAWPGITSNQGTEYMVLGSVGQYQLLTTYKVDVNADGDTNDPEDERQVVKAFEQYWKTFDTLRKKIFGDPASSLSAEDPTTVPATPLYSVTIAASKASNRDYLEQVMGFHHYTKWAYAKRWNGYNISGAKSKGWEEIEHWYQTINMGEGYFDFVPVTIEPAMILLDQHGWEIMRKPLPSSPDDETKEAKYEAIRPYNSPMVKEYHFWGSAKKRTGFHQYYNLSGQMKVDGENYTSTDLTKLPDYYNSDGTRNSTIFDKKGNQLDQYVTYVVKDEYVQSFNSATGIGAKFLIQQGDNYASTSDGTSITTNAVADPGGMSQTIVAANGSFSDAYLWYVKPNPDIDIEMGYQDAVKYPGGYAHDWTNDYTVTDFSTGFDPYNIQITSAAYPAKYFVTDATGAKIDDGAWVGNNSGSAVSLGDKTSVSATGHDSRAMLITNATFMAVQDEDGNMQLMPRFDHTQRVSSFSSLVVDHIGDAVKLPNTYTKLFLPAVYNYHIIDNSGNESLRYQSGGDLTPHIPTHFQSPLAKDYKYYKEIACANEIAASLAGAGKTDATNDVYIRYAYDEDADDYQMLKGKWFTMQLNEKNAKYDSGIKEGSDKPAIINASEKAWQWKFLETPQTAPDPYAVYIYNRSQSEGTKAIANRFAILSHTSGDFALAVAGSGDYTYSFLNGTSMTTSVAASTVAEPGFTSTSCTFSGTGPQLKLIDDVYHTYLYKVYTNALNFAISAEQIQAEASQNEFVPTLPAAIMTPLLNSDQFLYYEKAADMGNSAKELSNLYGMYEDDVYVRYTAYDELRSGYKVPNDKTTSGGNVARGNNSNDTPLGLSGNLFYNIIWYADNMMKSNGSTITYLAGQNLKAETDYEWLFDGNDPYAITIKNLSGNKIYESSTNNCTLSSDNATTFMLLNKDGYEYGVLQKTGGSNMLSGYGQKLEASDATHPTKFVIFALATHKVIYHLVIANTGNLTEEIPYRANQTMPSTPVAWNASTDKKQFDGTTQRNLTGTTYQLGSTISLGGSGVNYCFDAGHISLGDQLACPTVFFRPNVTYHYIVEGVYSNEACTEPISAMNDKYKGYELKKMGDDTGLLGKTVRINIVYNFNGELETNTGTGFVTDVSHNEWYTFETPTNEGTPQLAQYTNAWGLKMLPGREMHYTNDFLWSPLGDPYGFKMYNRYIYKTSNQPTYVLQLVESPANNGTLKVDNVPTSSAADYDIFELLSGGHEGTFHVHPLVNRTGTQYYLKVTNDGIVKLNSIGSEWTFGLSEEMMKPYYEHAGCVGGLTPEGKTAYETAAAIEDPGSRLLAMRDVVYAHEATYIVQFTPGYYRLRSPKGTEGVAPIRYASGYTHKKELTAGAGNTPIPMHFYEKVGVETAFDVLPSKDGLSVGTGFTSSAATQGEIPIPAVEYDPASIFHITGTFNAAKMSTQGLYVHEEHMTETEGAATAFYLMDIGGGLLLIHDNAVPADRKYFCYDQTDAAHIYDLKFIHDCSTDHARWCIEPANDLGLYVKTHSGGDEDIYGTTYNYCSLYLPFDILLPETDATPQGDRERERVYWAFICDNVNSPWDPSNDDLHPKPIGRYSKAGSRPDAYNTDALINRFVPAGTPVLLAMWDQDDYVKVTLPTSTPSYPMTTELTYTYGEAEPVSCANILSGQHLEQKLTAGNDVYVFGLPLNGTIEKDNDDLEHPYTETGNIKATLPTQSNTGLGFYLNANPNKELGPSRGYWTRNNWYVLGNKVYYRASGGTPAPNHMRDVQYVPVIFGDGEEGDEDSKEEEEDMTKRRDYVGDNCVYDLLGRKVASAAEVKAGTWYRHLQPGVYILNGHKIYVGVGWM